MVDSPVGRAGIVFNPVKTDRARLEELVDAARRDAGMDEALWFETDADDAGLSAARRAIEARCTLVVAAGGDGTVRAVAEAMRGTGIPFAVVPEGTGNLYARNVGISLAIDDAVRTAFLGTDREVDLGVIEIEREDGHVEERAFLVVAGAGIDAKMIAKTSTRLKKAVGWLAYLDGGMRALPESTSMRLRYRVDDGPRRSMSAHTLMVGNCGELPGGILLLPEAVIDDGLLDIVALRPRGRLGWLKVWQKIAWENGVLRKSAAGRKIIALTSKDVRSVTYLRGSRIEVWLAGSHELQLDGDGFGLATGLTAYADAGALTVRVPTEPQSSGSAERRPRNQSRESTKASSE